MRRILTSYIHDENKIPNHQVKRRISFSDLLKTFEYFLLGVTFRVLIVDTVMIHEGKQMYLMDLVILQILEID